MHEHRLKLAFAILYFRTMWSGTTMILCVLGVENDSFCNVKLIIYSPFSHYPSHANSKNAMLIQRMQYSWSI